jgi:hypothetical protein
LFKKRMPVCILLLVLCSLSNPGRCFASVASSAGNLVSRHLAGEWHLASALSTRLTGSGGGAPDQVSIQEDPSTLGNIPPAVENAVAGSPIFLAGSLQFEASRFSFLLAEKDGTPVLICFPQGQEGVRPIIVLLALVPAKDKVNDLLFLGGETETQPFFAYERAEKQAGPHLTAETGRLLDIALGGSISKELSQALEELPKRPDWQSVVNTLLEDIRRDPAALHNNRLITLRAIVSAHLQEVRVDLDPLIAALGTERWTNQQKTADLLAKMAEHKALFKNKEQPVIRALIPLTSSQRGLVTEPALLALHRLAGSSSLQREPEAWARWFEAKYHDTIRLEGTVYELVTVIGTEEGDAGTRRYRIGSRLYSLGDIQKPLQAAIEEARQAGLRPSFAFLVTEPITSAETEAAGVAEAEPARTILERLGIQDLLLVPKDARFYEPFKPGYPPSTHSDSNSPN